VRDTHAAVVSLCTPTARVPCTPSPPRTPVRTLISLRVETPSMIMSGRWRRSPRRAWFISDVVVVVELPACHVICFVLFCSQCSSLHSVPSTADHYFETGWFFVWVRGKAIPTKLGSSDIRRLHLFSQFHAFCPGRAVRCSNKSGTSWFAL